MKLLLVSATKAELAPVFKLFNLPDEAFIQTAKFDVLITGVGMTATAFALGKHLNPNYSLVLNVGIAGSFDINIPLGSLVNIVSDTFSELGAGNHDEFITIDELGFGKNTFQTNFDLASLPKVKGITVNKVHGNAANILAIQHKFHPQTESMEGAAVLYSCNQSNISCLQVRSISNYVVPRAKEDWEISLAIKNLNIWVIEFITQQIK
jgi:futalosine hydrolase